MNASASITIGNSRYEVAVNRLLVTLACLPATGSARLRVSAALELSAGVGDEATISLSHDGHEEDVLTGAVRSLRRGFETVELVIADGSAALSAFRPAVTYEAMKAAEIIESLAREAGVDVGRMDGGDQPLAFYVADQGRTAGEHIGSLAEMSGAMACFDGSGSLTVFETPAGTPDKALLYGRELLAYETSVHPTPTQRVVLGNGVAGSVDAPDALLPSFERLPGNAAGPGKSARWISGSRFRTPDAATAATSAANLWAGMQTGQVFATCFLQPDIRPGHVLEVQQAPAGASGGPWLVTRVEHVMDMQRGAWTRFTGVSTEGGGLLDSLISAVGGLL